MIFTKAAAMIAAFKTMRRESWPTGHFVFRQVPAVIQNEKIPMMQSLPDDAKTALFMRGTSISYDNQVAYVDENSQISGYAFSNEDILASDWIELTKTL